MAQSLREILPPLRSVWMTRDVWVNYYIITIKKASQLARFFSSIYIADIPYICTCLLCRRTRSENCRSTIKKRKRIFVPRNSSFTIQKSLPSQPIFTPLPQSARLTLRLTSDAGVTPMQYQPMVSNGDKFIGNISREFFLYTVRRSASRGH